MLQIMDFNKQLKGEIIELENNCMQITKRLEECYCLIFEKYGARIAIDLIRNQKGKEDEDPNVFDENYESFIEIAIEEDEDYYPNAYIPIWKCKKEMFHQIGYKTKWDSKGIERKITRILQEMLQERMEEIKQAVKEK